MTVNTLVALLSLVSPPETLCADEWNIILKQHNDLKASYHLTADIPQNKKLKDFYGVLAKEFSQLRKQAIEIYADNVCYSDVEDAEVWKQEKMYYWQSISEMGLYHRSCTHMIAETPEGDL